MFVPLHNIVTALFSRVLSSASVKIPSTPVSLLVCHRHRQLPAYESKPLLPPAIIYKAFQESRPTYSLGILEFMDFTSQKKYKQSGTGKFLLLLFHQSLGGLSFLIQTNKSTLDTLFGKH